MQNQKAVFVSSLLVVFLASIFGGGQGFFGDVLAQLAATFTLLLCLFNAQSELGHFSRKRKLLIFGFLVVVLLVPLLQLYPWQASSAYALAIQQDMQKAGVLSNGSVYKYYGAERALFFLLPACSVFIATLQLSRPYRFRLLIAIGLIVLSNIFLGFAQLAQGQDSALRLYAITNRTEAVGFFANRNHLASLLMMYLPLAISVTAWAVYQRQANRVNSTTLAIGGALFCVLMILAIAVARSRAGLLLGMLGVLLSLPALFALPRSPGFKRLLGAIAVLAVVASIQFAFFGVMQRFDKGVGDTTRAQMTNTSIEAGKAFAPMGSGLGTFRDAYPPFEAKAGNMDNTITNHAHNDYAELWLEAGYPGVLAIGLFWLLFSTVGWILWFKRKQGDSIDVLLSRAAWIGVLLALLHSYVDYPLRTTANATLFAVLLALTLTTSRRQQKN